MLELWDGAGDSVSQMLPMLFVLGPHSELQGSVISGS